MVDFYRNLRRAGLRRAVIGSGAERLRQISSIKDGTNIDKGYHSDECRLDSESSPFARVVSVVQKSVDDTRSAKSYPVCFRAKDEVFAFIETTWQTWPIHVMYVYFLGTSTYSLPYGTNSHP